MAEQYKSNYTGQEIDAGIEKANSAVQPSALNAYQTKIDNDNKLSADLISDGETNKTVTETEKTTWSAKQDAIDSENKLSSDLIDDSTATNKFVTSNDKTTWSGKQDALVSGTNIKTINSTSILGSGNIDIQTTYEFSPTELGDGYFKMTQTDIDYIYQNKPTLLTMNVDMGGGVRLRADFIFGQTTSDSSDIIYTMIELENTMIQANSFKIDDDTTSNDNITLSYMGFYIDNYQTKTDQNLQTTNKTVVNAINEVNSIAKGANKAVVFSNYSLMVSQFNLAPSTRYNSGNNIYIIQLDIPDLWVSSIESSSVTYHYTTDEAFTTALETDGYVQVGYYKLSALETQKVDLTGYQTLIDSSHKLSADLVDDTSTTNKFVTASEKSSWTNKQDTLVSGTTIKSINNTSILGAGNLELSSKKSIDISNNNNDFTQAQIQDVYTNKYDVITIITSQTTSNAYKAIDLIESAGVIGYLSYPPNGGGITAYLFVYDSDQQQYMVQTEVTIPQVEGTNDGTNWTKISIGGNEYSIPAGGTEVSGTNDGTNWTSITIGNTTKAIPAGGSPQLIATKTIDLNVDTYGAMVCFPMINQILPGHYYIVTMTDNWGAPGNILEGVIEIPVFNGSTEPGKRNTHFGVGSLVFWQEDTVSPTGTPYGEAMTVMMEMDYDPNDNTNYCVWITFDTAWVQQPEFNDGAIIKVYYKPL